MKKLLVLVLILLQIIATTYAGSSCSIVESNKYDLIKDFTYSPNGKSYAFMAKKNGKEILVKDGKEITKYDFVWYLKYSPDGKSFAFLAYKDGKYLLVKDGREITKYDGIRSFKYSPDGKSLVFIAKKD